MIDKRDTRMLMRADGEEGPVKLVRRGEAEGRAARGYAAHFPFDKN
ncbi:MAG TPA: hypothetical protein VFE78_36165 [Gemmataceae bacterium]|nr:hypothetical protein [Gemmataceae bacterium]